MIGGAGTPREEGMGQLFETVYGRGLIPELKTYVHRPYLVVTMADLWPRFRGAFDDALAGPLFEIFGEVSFFINGAIYLLALVLFAYGVKDHHSRPDGAAENRLRRYVHLFRQRGILLFVPTWVAINAIVGVWVPQGLYLLTGSSGVGVTYAFETYSPIAGGRIPLQMAIADRALADVAPHLEGLTEIEVRNRAEGGLEAELTLPRRG